MARGQPPQAREPATDWGRCARNLLRPAEDGFSPAECEDLIALKPA